MSRSTFLFYPNPALVLRLCSPWHEYVCIGFRFGIVKRESQGRRSRPTFCPNDDDDGGGDVNGFMPADTWTDVWNARLAWPSLCVPCHY